MVSCGWEKTGYFSPRWKQDSDSWSSSLLCSEQSPRTIGVTAPDNQLLYPLHLGAAINKRWPQRRKAGLSPPTDTGNPAKSTHPPKSQSTQWFGITLRAKQELERKAQPTRSWPRAAAAKPAEEHDRSITVMEGEGGTAVESSSDSYRDTVSVSPPPPCSSSL